MGAPGASRIDAGRAGNHQWQMSEPAERTSAGDVIAPECVQIRVHVNELRQLFNAMDPSPFRERDLDPKAEEFIVDWAKEAPRDARLAMVVHLDRAAGRPDEATALRDAVHEYFAQRALVTRRRLREMLRRGRISLIIGIVTLTALFLLGDLIAHWLTSARIHEPLRESLLIGGWVAMWRPLEIFLYDWWPMRADARLYDRLATMPVRITYTNETKEHAWRNDWPAVPAAAERQATSVR
jgi:hypothetical protein